MKAGQMYYNQFLDEFDSIPDPSVRFCRGCGEATTLNDRLIEKGRETDYCEGCRTPCAICGDWMGLSKEWQQLGEDKWAHKACAEDAAA